MGTFTEDLKNEIIRSKLASGGERKSFLSAYLRTSGSIFYRGDDFGFEIVTENERTAEYICDLISGEFGVDLTVSDASRDIKNGKNKLKFEYVGKEAPQILNSLGIIKSAGGESALTFGIEDRLISNADLGAAYVKGAFLGGGSCTLPHEQTYSRTGYHFEVVFSNKFTAGEFCRLLSEFEILAKLVSRKDCAVVYVKSKEVISDILNLLQAYSCLERLNKISEYKDRVNNDNRVNNCSVSNIDRSLTASVGQIKAIEVIAQTLGLQSLDANLFEVAEARLADKNASMQELADRLHISKSCINHRMRKIIAISSQLN